MRSFRKISAFLLLLALATACTTASLEELRRTVPSGSPFQAALSQEYLAFSESEARQYDWPDSKYFADKGLMAVYGQDVPPELIENWDIDPSFIEELKQARSALVTALTPEHLETKPALAARTQFFFDCWVEQQEENWQEDDISACREGFYKSLTQLQDQAIPEEEPLIFSSSYILFFDWNRWDINADGMKVVDEVAEEVKTEQEPYEIILNGHADRSGSTEYNLTLSQNRAEAVKKELIKRGVPDGNISYFAFGESDNRIPTKDGVKEKANRRVEIFFNQ